MTCMFLVNLKVKYDLREVLICSLCKLRSFLSLLFGLQMPCEQILCQKCERFMLY